MSNQYPSWWTEARIDELRLRFFAGESFGEIAWGMGATSRNAVIGKAHRIGLYRPRPASQPNGRTHSVPHRVNGHHHRPKAAPMIEDPPAIAFSNPVTLMELQSHHCRFPGPGETNGPHTLFCGNPAYPGQSYCLHHWRLAHQKWPRRGIS